MTSDAPSPGASRTEVNSCRLVLLERLHPERRLLELHHLEGLLLELHHSEVHRPVDRLLELRHLEGLLLELHRLEDHHLGLRLMEDRHLEDHLMEDRLPGDLMEDHWVGRHSEELRQELELVLQKV